MFPNPVGTPVPESWRERYLLTVSTVASGTSPPARKRVCVSVAAPSGSVSANAAVVVQSASDRVLLFNRHDVREQVGRVRGGNDAPSLFRIHHQAAPRV